MSISRRQFVLGTAAGLILPSYYDRIFTYLENHGEPLIEAPRQAGLDLYAVDWGGGVIEFHLGEVAIEPPAMTIREYAKRYFGDDQGYLDTYCCERDGIDVDFDAIQNEGMVLTCWQQHDSPMAKAYRLLEGLDLGRDFDDEDSVGQIEFVDCPNMCSSLLAAQTEDAVSVSLLQKRLNELNTGVRITMQEGE